MDAHCRNCGEPAARTYDDWFLCERYAERFEEHDRNLAAADAGLIEWNVLTHDPFWRGWLASRELFDAFRVNAPAVGKRVHTVAGGDVFECLRGVYDCWLQVWMTDTKVMVAYPPFGERYEGLDDPDGLRRFAGWAEHLRTSPPLEPGRVRGRCSYGAVLAGGEHPPVVSGRSGVTGPRPGGRGTSARAARSPRGRRRRGPGGS